ncbi:MAG: phage portal protein, partial [Novosphingobium sp.]
MSFIQTLAAAFKGGAPSRVPLGRSFFSPWLYAEGTARAPFDYARSVKRGYAENPVVQRSVRLVAEGIGGAPLSPVDLRLAALVQATSAGQSLLETLASQLLLHGNAYVQVIKDGLGTPVELFALRPERVSVLPGPDGWPSSYAYKVGEQALTIPVLDEHASPNLIHIRFFHPGDDHYGAGCLAAAEEAVLTHNAAAAWNRQLLENAARPSGALVYDPGDGAGLSADQFERLKQELSAAYAGHANAGRPMLLEGGLKWQSLSLSPADMDFAERKAAAARDIALAFGVPPMLLVLPGDATYANYRGWPRGN